MGFFKRLFGNKDRIEPFPEHQNDFEKLRWFRKTPPWDKIDDEVINAILMKYKDNPMIVVFVVTSMKHNLIPMYSKYNNSELLDSPIALCSQIALILYRLGSASLKQMIPLVDNLSNNEEEFKQHYSTVLDSFESCIILDEYQVFAYHGLAIAKLTVNRYEDVLKYAKQGLAVIQEIKESGFPFIDMSNSMPTLEEIEISFNQLIEQANNVKYGS